MTDADEHDLTLPDNGCFGCSPTRDLVIKKGIVAAATNTISTNRIANNVGNGVEAGDANTIAQKTLAGNGDNGISTGGGNNASTTIAKNTANGNDGQGIDVSAGAPQGAGTNKAQGNAANPQCDGGLC